MTSYIAVLRGINVSGQKKMNMHELKDLFVALNFSHVKTYIQSGNVVFAYEEASSGELSRQIEQKIAEKYGFHVPVLIRTYPELTDIIRKNTLNHVNSDNIYVTFLSDTPAQTKIDQINTLQYTPDTFVISAREVYVCCPNGYGRTKLHNNFFENKLKVAATTRNWKTVNELAKMASAIPA